MIPLRSTVLPRRAAGGVLSLLLVLVTACARARGADSGTASPSAQQAQADPAGQYSYTSNANGQQVSGTITITRTESGLRGVMTTGGLSRDIPFDRVQVNGARVVLESSAGASRVMVDFTRTGDAIRGTWSMGALGGELQGRRVPQ